MRVSLPKGVWFAILGGMECRRINKDGETLLLPGLTAVTEKEGEWFVARCPQLGVASQGKTRAEAYTMLAEAVALWLEHASAREIKRRLKYGGTVRPLELIHA